MILVVWCLFLVELVLGAKLRNCPTSDIKFEKILGLRPSDSVQNLLLHKSDTPAPVTTECISKCHSNDDCRGFVIYYNVSTCYWYKSSTEGAQETENVIDNAVAWFNKVCLNGKKCEKLWSFERIPGAVLIGNDTKILPKTVSRNDCEQYCLNETEFRCKSAKYRITRANFGPNAETEGVCTLSDSDRHLLPNSYRVSSFDEEYFENQCAANHDEYGLSNEFCAYEEYVNVSLGHSDLFFEKRTKEDCERMCEELKTFHCRGYSLQKVGSSFNTFNCALHSEDTKIHGPKLLVTKQDSTYYEKARCLNISVDCSKTYMTVRYNPETNFMGRIYMQGYSDHPECFAVGQGKSMIVTLKMALLSSQCGITLANGVYNRTLLAGTMILQYNSLIQTQGDRVIKVGCIFGNETKVLVGTGVTISSSLSNRGSSIVKNSSNKTTTPTVEMRVVDLHSHEEVSDTEIGQELQLVIDVKPTEPLDIWAGHLVAMTEKSDESIFLLDDRGCPTNLNIFPTLEKIVTKDSRKLVGTFQAFKFATSPIVRFSVVVQFCPNECPPINCGGNVVSNGRKRRDVIQHRIQTINGTAIVKINRTMFEGRSTVINEMPLEYVMVVRDPKSVSDRLVIGDNKILVAGYDYEHNYVCLDYSLVIGLIITWVIIQIIFVIICLILVRRYKRYYEHECTRQSLEELHKNFGIGFSNLENRRVHWADHEDMT